MGESASSTIVAAPACADSTCPEPGQWRPVVHVFDERGAKIPGEVVLPSILTCDAHKEDATKGIIENDILWERIVRAFSGWRRGKIDRAKTKISYEPI